jgi:branched-chain amino acid transport system substrate-binding protein
MVGRVPCLRAVPRQKNKMAFASPRGPISIDPDTRDIVSNIYIRKVVKKDGQLWSEEFETYPSVKDPMKAAAAK